ncbi:uroporphyrinogen-III C-methyltransferase [Arthrobacter bussei]|uniref:uroporphyrinogen-III C-methyltransferase n=1 Tax=Arthrobacter bussei TaxID=2594179 RepID=A0A7X1NN46_9MICC|nr:uroporphyrinogen-III C-methyltransferase [Arthrobacter bussei]MPY09798.1 uroporphyrinogen-III C-methyltransferase [Arthrobacter bussei]
MQLEVDLAGQRIVVVGAEQASRRVLARYRAAGADVERVSGAAALHPGALAGARLVVLVESAHGGGFAPPAADVPAVAAGSGPAATDRTVVAGDLRERCRDAGVLVVREEAAAVGPGHVTLIGGGPGALGLLTLDAAAALREADVVLYDRLAPTEDLAVLAPAAELIDVGKLPGHHRVPQSGINDLLVRYAREGRHVVRLKGGDPFVFGRGSEELAACLEARVPCRVVPGVSSAISVPAAAGIPVTHRGVSHLFTVVSGHAPLSEEEHLHLAGLGGTIVVLMGVSTLPQLVAGLGRAGMRPGMPVAVVERGYSASQRTTAGTLATIVTAAGAARCQSPAVLVIGEVVRVGLELQGGATHLARLTESLAS